MIADAKKKLFDAVVVYKTDRFARNKYDSAIYKRQLRQNDVKIYYAAESIPDGPEGIILESLMEGLAEYYSAELAQKIKRGMTESALKCQSTGAGHMLGYKTGPDKHFQIEPDGAVAVKDIFDRYIAGESCASICERLNARGFRTAQGRPFNKNSLNRIVQNKKYTGVFIWHDIEIPGGMPRIISDEVFAAAQREFAKRKAGRAPRSASARYLLSGKAFCGHCKAPMHGVSGTSKSGEKYYYYYCSNSRGSEKTCNKKKVGRDALEGEVAELTINYVLQEDTLREIAEKLHEYMARQSSKNDELAVYTKALADNKKAIDNIILSIEKGVSSKALLDRLEQLENERELLKEDLAQCKLKTPVLTTEQITFALKHFGDMRDSEDLQAYHARIIKCFVSAVYVYDDRLLLVFNLTGANGVPHQEEFSTLEGDVFDQGSECSTISFLRRTQSVIIAFLPFGFVVEKKLTR